MNKLKTDLTGQRFGRLIVIKYCKKGSNNKYSKWECLCDCGKLTRVTSSSLKTGTVRSCRCYQKDCLSSRFDRKLSRLNAIVRYSKRNAKVRGIVWELTKEQSHKILKEPCSYCEYFDEVTLSGIDRVDNSKGYTLENSVSYCRWCNWGKNERTIEQFKNWIVKLYVNFSNSR
jgi:hypothetical protein